MISQKNLTPSINFLSGGGKMGEFIRKMDWSATSVGDPVGWPQSLSTSVSICLNSRFPLLIWWGKDLVKIYNDAYCDLIAAKHPKAMGAKAADVWPEILPNVLPMLKGILKDGEATCLEDQLHVIERNGRPEVCYFTFSYSAIRDEAGNVGGIFCAVNETTKKVVAERKLSTLLNNLFIQAPVAICIFRGENYIVEVVNKLMLEFWGRTQNEVLTKPVFEALPEVKGQGFKELLDTVYKKGERFVAEEHPISLMRHGNMENAFVKFIYEPLREEDGTISGIMAVAHDITEQVVARKNAEESELHFRQMADLMPAKITNTNADGRVTYYNKNWKDYSGMSFENFRDFGYHKIMHPDEQEEFKKRFNKAVETGNDLEMEMRFLNTEGEYIWHLNRASPVKDENGKIKMWIGVTSEIQKIKNEGRLKDNFLSMASHELKTPVTTIKAYGQIAEMMLQEKGDAETLAVVSRMGGQINKLTRLIGDLLDFTRIQQGKLMYNESFFDFNEFMKGVVEDIRHTSVTHKISYIQSAGAQVFGDQEKLSQVVANLISNAIKYSPGAEKIVITSTLQKEGVELCFQDFGIGVRKEDQPRVFEQFYRVTGDTQSTFPGMGIGLYICAEIIKRHGGKIWVESSSDKGSVFCLWLPSDYRDKITGLAG